MVMKSLLNFDVSMVTVIFSRVEGKFRIHGKKKANNTIDSNLSNSIYSEKKKIFFKF